MVTSRPLQINVMQLELLVEPPAYKLPGENRFSRSDFKKRERDFSSLNDAIW